MSTSTPGETVTADSSTTLMGMIPSKVYDTISKTVMVQQILPNASTNIEFEDSYWLTGVSGDFTDIASNRRYKLDNFNSKVVWVAKLISEISATSALPRYSYTIVITNRTKKTLTGVVYLTSVDLTQLN